VTEAAPKISPNVSNEENSNVQFVCQKIIKWKQKTMFDNRKFKKIKT
jgi:hypothetical protein